MRGGLRPRLLAGEAEGEGEADAMADFGGTRVPTGVTMPSAWKPQSSSLAASL